MTAFSRTIGCCFGILVFALFSSNLSADETESEQANSIDDTDFDTTELLEFEQQVVSTPIAPTDNTTATATTIYTEEYETQSASLSSVVRSQEGVYVKETGGLGSYATISIRGSSSEQVPVYLDGIQLNNSGMMSVNLGSLHLRNYESIEIYQGQTPLRVGVGGIGGALRLNTVKNDPRTEVVTTLGSFRTLDVVLLQASDISDIGLLVVANLQHSDGDFEFYNDNGTFHTTADDAYERRQNNQHSQFGLLVKLNGETQRWTWTVLNDVFLKEQGLVITSNLPSKNTRLSQRRDILGASLKRQITPRIQLRVFPSGTVYSEAFQDPDNQVGIGVQDIRTVTTSFSSPMHLDVSWRKIHNTLLLLGVSAEHIQQKNLLIDHATARHGRMTLQSGASHRVDIKKWMAELAALWHFEYAETLAADATHSLSGMEGDDHRAAYFTPSAGLRYSMTDGVYLRMNGGRYLRQPSLTELFGEQGYKVGNPTLAAEEGYNVDIGFSATKDNFSKPTLVHFQSTAFYSWIDHLIAYIPISQNTVRAENISSARIFGVASGASLELARRFEAHVKYTFLLPLNDSDNPLYHNKYLPGKPMHTAFGKLSVKRSFLNFQCRLWADAEYAARNYIDQANLMEDLLSRFFVGLGGSVTTSDDQFSISLEAKNLLNRITAIDSQGNLRQLRDYDGYPLPGRQVLTTFRWKY